MEKGIIKSFDKSCGLGTITRVLETEIRFYAESIIGKDRADLITGDSVLFETSNIKNLNIAVNIRKVQMDGQRTL